MEKNQIRQQNSITEARYELSALQKNIIYMLLSELRDEESDKRLYYEIDIGELEERLNQKLSISELIKAAEELVFRPYTIRKDDGSFFYNVLVSSVENFPERNTLELGINSAIKPYFLGLKRDYTEFQLDVALSLKSKYSKRLYEMLAQHKEKGTLEITIEELKYRFFLKDDKTGKDTYPTWTLFKKQVLDIPQKELEEYADLTFTYKAEKTGKKYTHLTFDIKQVDKPFKNGQTLLF